MRATRPGACSGAFIEFAQAGDSRVPRTNSVVTQPDAALPRSAPVGGLGRGFCRKELDGREMVPVKDCQCGEGRKGRGGSIRVGSAFLSEYRIHDKRGEFVNPTPAQAQAQPASAKPLTD